MRLLDVTLIVGIFCTSLGLPLVNRLAGRPEHVVHYHNDGGVPQAHIHIKRDFEKPSASQTGRAPNINTANRHGSQLFRGSNSQQQIDVDSLISEYRNLHHRRIDGLGHVLPNTFSQHPNEPDPAEVRTKLGQLVAQAELIPAPTLNFDNFTPPPSFTTQRPGGITKRGVTHVGTFSANIRTPPPRSYLENFFHLRVWNTTTNQQSHTSKPQQLRAGHLHTVIQTSQTNGDHFSATPATPETRQNEPPVQQIVKPVKATINKSSNNITADPIAPLGKTEVVRLDGIHIMFSNAMQNTSTNIPTIHLTAAIDNAQSTVLNSGLSSQDSASKQTALTDTIVGTAVIRNGHLYLVVYPFGNNKEVTIKMQNETLRLNSSFSSLVNSSTELLKLPRNKPISLQQNYIQDIATTVSNVLVSHTKDVPTSMEFKVSTKTATPVSETTPSTVTQTLPTLIDHNHEHGNMKANHTHRTTTTSVPKTAPTVNPLLEFEALLNDFGNHQNHHHLPVSPDHHGHGSHSHHSHSDQPKKPSASLERFKSPWKSLNLSDVFPYPKIKTSFDKRHDDDNDVKVVSFIANATDPFEDIKKIIAKLANQTQNGTDSSSGTFNFEIKLQGNNNDVMSNQKEATTKGPVTDYASEERTTSDSWTTKDMENETSTPSLGFNSELHRTLYEELKTSIKMKHSSGPKVNVTTMHPVIPDITTATPRATETFTKATSLLDEYMNDFVSKDSKYKAFTKPATSDIQLTSVILNRNRLKSQTHPYQTIAQTGSTAKVNILPNTVASERLKTLIPISNTVGESHAKFQKTSSFAGGTSAQGPRPMSGVGNINIATSVSAEQFRKQETVTKMPNASPISKSQPSPIIPISPPSERIISLVDIYNDINRFRLHNIQRFNIQNNIMLSESQQPSISRDLVENRPPVFQKQVPRESPAPRQFTPSSRSNHGQISGPFYTQWDTQQLHQHTQQPLRQLPTRIRHQPHHVSSDNQLPIVGHTNNNMMHNSNLGHSIWNDPFSFNSAMDAMLVLSVEDIMADHATLHGAIVLANRDGSSSSSSSSNNNN